MPGDELPDAQYERLKRHLQETILTEYPNPERKGCPGDAVLRRLASRYMDDEVKEDPQWHHVTHCSPCYQEFLDHRAEMKRTAKRRTFILALGLAGVVVALLAVTAYFGMRRDGRGFGHPQRADRVYSPRVVDLESRTITRSFEPKEEARPIILGRGPEELTIRLPLGSRPGRYELQLLKEVDQPLVSTSGEAQLVDRTASLVAKVDLSKFAQGRYLLGIRRVESDWTYYPADLK